MDSREPLNEGSTITLGNKIFVIYKLIGYGATSFVYLARYNDSLQADKSHNVLIKELFPYHSKGLIKRDEKGVVTFTEDASSFFELQKKSFMRGNMSHIDLQNLRADMTNINIDSFEENGSVYTITGNLDGETMKDALCNSNTTVSLSCALAWMLSLLDALDIFHKNGLLHLDISPDNILLLPLDEGKSEKFRKILLIDYNSVWSTDELNKSSEIYFSIKEGYSPPELRLKERSSISEASDLFSVCAVFLELLTGKVLDFSVLYTGGRIIDTKVGLCKDTTEVAKLLIMKIIKQGLKLSPNRRYQSISGLRADLSQLSDIVDGNDIFQRLSIQQKKRVLPIAIIMLMLAFALSFVAIYLSDSLSSYPKSQKEINASQNAMTALSASVGKLGEQIKNDNNALNAYNKAYADFQKFANNNKALNDTLILSDKYNEDSIKIFKTTGSPIVFDVLIELLNAPNEYRAWSNSMFDTLEIVLKDNGKYFTKDKEHILDLYKQYIKSYTNAYYIKLQLVILPLNDEGRKDLLNALPYTAVFSDKFISQPFINNDLELESTLNAENMEMQDIIINLKSYGLEGW